ncbi:MAG: tRNA epoxyqueuosine(34) reductase QueG, partial [Chloroflexota bacterium]
MKRFPIQRSRLAELARDAHLSVAGVARPDVFERARDFTIEHVNDGHMAGMDWFTTERAREAADPRTLQSGVRSILAVAVPFWSGDVEPPDDGILRGRIARYAWGRDYHRVLKKRMKHLVTLLEEELGCEIDNRTLVDTARVFDRAVAERAGVGWYGKNTMIIVPGHGSWAMLAEIYLDFPLEADLPLNRDCGRCTICIDKCPTGAITEPYRIHAPRCISYLTIEERGAIPREIRPLMGQWVFGCDVCQEVCPYTRAAKIQPDPDFEPATIDNVYPSLELLATMDDKQYLDLFAGTAVTRAKRRGLARNAAIALGNSGSTDAYPILRRMLYEHDEPLARQHAAWGLQHLAPGLARADLAAARGNESDPSVTEEIDWAIEQCAEAGKA